ncbi:MAG: hypothetical protein ACD_3C00001G0019 [uncultured bacterium (gcode 4)]|uniref:DNA-directed DNA polymerase n=1 Tax=uncultured bacterium (gcode 4) TaxID=1234023 RepID=K2G0W1_9BACT|nr:MAG: hypothetical protein ACD_3C00001G0019 [uncultured bacterium (gcode 4)]
MSFVHLHVHTNFSILEWLGKPKEFVKKAKELWMTSLAITDTGNLYGFFEFYKSCKENDINPIIWIEASISKKWIWNKEKDNEFYEIVLLAKNREWLKNIIEMTTISWLNWFYYKPRIDFELLKKYSSNVIALSGSFLWEIPQHIITWKSEDFIMSRIEFYQNIFWKDDFYLELQEHPDRPSQSKVNEYILALSRNHDLKVVGTNDVHYLSETDSEAQDLLYSIWDGRALDDPDRPTLIEWNYALRSWAEMREIFSYSQSACNATLEIAEKIKIDIPYWETLIPVSELWEAEKIIHSRYLEYAKNIQNLKELWPEEWCLRYLCMKWLNDRYDYWFDEKTLFLLVNKTDVPWPDKKLSQMSAEELQALSKSYFSEEKIAFVEKLNPEQINIIDRLEYELVVVELMWFNGYFIIVADFINWAKNNWVPVWPWRWSAAWALLAYLSWITDIDPLKYSLLFERFLNPARVSMPDIDVDFSDEWRWRVLEYVRNKYWHDHVAQICTFGTMAARAAVKDIWKAFWVPFSEMNNVAKLIPAKPWIKIKDALEESTEFKALYASSDKYKKIIDNAMRLEWSVRQLWVHACAVIIAPAKMTEFCSLQHPPKDDTVTVTQLSQYPLEDLGLLKMDFLWLRNLTIIDRCLKIIKNQHDKDINLLKIDYEDKKVFKIFCDWDTTWVFQFESSWMRKYLKELKPNAFEDIIVMVSLYRPGPLAYIPTYINRKHWKEKVQYPHTSLEVILKPTQWIAVYQEQIMQLVQAFAWFSLWEADILRRAIGKKKIDLLMEQKEKFIQAAISNWHPKELAKYIFEDIIEPFAGYWFNKSHAACYSMIAYQTAYLKAYFPTEFMTALMVSDEEDIDRITLEIDECKAKKINVLAPDINESMKHFTFIDNDNIRFGLKAIKWLWSWPIDTIRSWRENWQYTDVVDLINKTSWDVINKKSLEALILSWALDAFWERASLLASISKITSFLKEHQKKQETNQTWLFDLWWWNHDDHRFSLEKAKPMTYEEKIIWEREVIWYSVTGHWLDWLKKYLNTKSSWLEHVVEFKKKMKEQAMLITEVEPDPIWIVSDDIEWNWEWEIFQEIPVPADVPAPIEEIEAPAPKVEPKWKYERKQDPKVKFFWLVTSIRKIQTKTGKLMMTANCDSTFFKFVITVFPKDYDKFVNLIQQDSIVMIDWNIRFNEQMEEISVLPTLIRSTTITSLRTQAQEIGTFNEDEIINYLDDWEDIITAVKKTEEKQEDKIAKTNQSKYVIKVPTNWTKDDLLNLKEMMMWEPDWDIKIFLDIRWQEVDTKISLSDINWIKKWVKENW